MFLRWHSGCLFCLICGDKALVAPREDPDSKSSHEGMTVITQPIRRPLPRTDYFAFEPVHSADAPEKIFCNEHQTPTCVHGFQPVSRLEQYAFLLHIALRRLYVHFRTHHELPSGEFNSRKEEMS